jgi:sec-independent protein translocase protein TatA
MLQNIGTTELVLIGVVLLFLVGGKKIPELAKGVADAIREFKDASKTNDQ